MVRFPTITVFCICPCSFHFIPSFTDRSFILSRWSLAVFDFSSNLLALSLSFMEISVPFSRLFRKRRLVYVRHTMDSGLLTIFVLLFWQWINFTAVSVWFSSWFCTHLILDSFRPAFLASLFQRVIVNSVENKWIIGVVLKSKQDFTSIERT